MTVECIASLVKERKLVLDLGSLYKNGKMVTIKAPSETCRAKACVHSTPAWGIDSAGIAHVFREMR